MFIRKKRIQGKEYAYLVKNEWTAKGARQKVSQYLGKVHVATPQHDVSFADFLKSLDLTYKEYKEDVAPQHFIQHIVAYELYKHGFQCVGSHRWQQGDISVDLQEATLTLKTMPVVVQLNNDFLCEHTLKALLSFSPVQDEQETAVALANAFVKAGIAVDPQLFIEVYQKFSITPSNHKI